MCVVSDYAAEIFRAAGNWHWPRVPVGHERAKQLNNVSKCLTCGPRLMRALGGTRQLTEQTFSFVPDGPALAR